MPKKKGPSLQRQVEQLKFDVAALEHGLAAQMISFIDAAHKAGAALELARANDRRLNRRKKP